MARGEVQVKCHLGWPKKWLHVPFCCITKDTQAEEFHPFYNDCLLWDWEFLSPASLKISLVNRFLWTGHTLEKTSYVGRGAENHGTVNFCAIWSIDFKCSEENMGMIWSKGPLSWSILPEKNFWKLLSEAAEWKSDKMSFESSSCSMADSQLKTKVLAGCLHKIFPAFWLPKKRLRQQYAAYGVRLCATAVMMTAKAPQGYDIPVQWTTVEGNLRNPRFYTRSFHALCSERKTTWKLDLLMSIHPSDKLKACCSEVTLERYPKTP